MTNKLALVVAVVLGVLSILGVRFYVEKIKTQYDLKIAPVDVPVAARDLKAGDVVQKGDIQIQQFPHGVVDALGGSHYLANETDKFEGRKIVVPSVRQGQVFQQYHFRAQQTSNKLGTIGSEFRAVTITVNAASGVAGMLRPGDKVDIIVSEGFKDTTPVAAPGAQHASKELKVTATMAQKVDVLAIDGYTDPESQFSEYTTVTLKLHPEDVNRLMHAVDAGWPYHLAKIDDTASPTSSYNPIFADIEYDRVEPEVKQFFIKKGQRAVNGGR